MMQQFFNQKVCLITGGAQGIGWAVAQVLADYGAEVYVCDISQENIANAQNELKTSSWRARVHFTQCDITNREAVESWIEQVYQEKDRIDVLINNAAFVRWESHEKITIEEEALTMHVGYEGMIYCIKAVLPRMKVYGSGHIVNIGSSAGRIFVGGSSAAYAAVKAAIDAYTHILQIELKDTPIQLTLVRPGVVSGTDFFRKHVSSSKLPRMGDFVPALTPPQVARAIVEGIYHQRNIVNVPRYLFFFYLFFDLFPGTFRWLSALGGGAQKRYD